MRIGFIYTEMETLGIQYLSSILKQNGHQTKLFFDPQLFMDTVTRNYSLGNFFDFSDKIIEDIRRYQADVIAFSVLTTNYHWVSNLAKKLKKLFTIPIIFGGIHPTSVPEEVLRNDFVDFVIVGEGEYAFLELVKSKLDKTTFPLIKNLGYKNNGNLFFNSLREPINNLDDLPFPDKDLFYDILPYLRNNYTIITGRGCPHRCTYCCNRFLNNLYQNRYLRRRSVDNVISELIWAKNNYHIKNVFFDDSTFSYDKEWLKNFAIQYKKNINLNCFCWIYPTDVNEELIELFKLMNCKAVEMGVESIDKQVRQNIFYRYYENSDIQKAIKLFNENKIFCTVDNIKGFSNNPEQELVNMIRFYNENRPNKIYIFEHRPFPKTEIRGILYDKKSSLSADVMPFTIATSHSPKVVRQLELLTALIYFMPKKIIKLILKIKLYRFFPPLSSYNILEILPYFLGFLKMSKSRYWYPIRGTRRRYIHYLFYYRTFFIKKFFRKWG